MTGIIKTINKEKLFGFITSNEDGKDYFFHASGLDGWDFNDANRGTRVEFTPTMGAKGSRAEKVVRI